MFSNLDVKFFTFPKKKKGIFMQASGKDLLTLLKEEDSTLKRKDLLEKLVDDSLWATKSVYKEIIPERELQDVKK